MKVSGRRYLKAESLLAQTKGRLRRSGLRVRKGLGQHFLIDEEVLGLVVSAAQLTPTDIVMEIGPGLGVLTRELAGQAGWVVAIELDNKLAEIVKRKVTDKPDSIGHIALVPERFAQPVADVGLERITWKTNIYATY